MITIVKQTLQRLRGQIIGWGIALGLFGMMMVSFFNTIAGQGTKIDDLLKLYPKDMMAFIGDFSQYSTPVGFLNTEFFSMMPIILGIFALLVGSGLVAADEENGNLDLILAHPVSRSSFFWGRFGGTVLATTLIMAIAWLGMILAKLWASFSLDPAQLAVAFLPLLGIIFLYFGVAVLMSMLLPSRKLAAMVTALLVVGGFLLNGLSKIGTKLRDVGYLLPNHYYQGADAIHGMNWKWFLGYVVVGFVCSLAGYLLFERRDIRVMGEGQWRIKNFKGKTLNSE